MQEDVVELRLKIDEEEVRLILLKSLDCCFIESFVEECGPVIGVLGLEV